MYKHKYKSTYRRETISFNEKNEKNEKNENNDILKIPDLIIDTLKEINLKNKNKNIDKKELAINTIIDTLDKSDMFGEYEEFILPLIPILIDKFIDIENGNIKLNKNYKFMCC